MVNRRFLSRRHAGFVAFLALALSLAPQQGHAAPPSGHPANISVTTYFSDTDSGGNPSWIASDGNGAYHDGADGVMSILTTNGYNGIVWGDWQFQTYGSTTRTVGHLFDMAGAALPGDLHYSAPANPPYLGTQDLPSRVQVMCTLLNNDMLTMNAGSSFTCPLHNKFNMTDGTQYFLDPANSWSHYAETTDVQVTCNTADSGGCNDWYIDPLPITPSPTGQTGAVGRLTTPSPSKGKPQPDINDGDFYMKFHIHVTRP